MCRTDPQFACVCGNNLMHSQDLRTLEVNLTQKAIVAIQPQDLVSFETFQDLLGMVWFQHSPAPPSGSYISTVSIVVFDGQLYSEPAFTTVAVWLLPATPAPILEEVIINHKKSFLIYIFSHVGWCNQQ